MSILPYSALLWIFMAPGVAATPGVSFKLNQADISRTAPAASPAPAFQAATAPQAPAKTTATTNSGDRPGREFFVSWGYNGNSYSKQDIHFSQPSLGNDFSLLGVQPHDSKAWTDLFNHALTVPQYNVRGGYFWNEKWGLELAMDHIKWIVTQDQSVRMTGTLNGAPVEADVVLTTDVLKYQLNNGANPVFVNLVRRYRLAGQHGRTGYFTFLAKAGGGFAVPHTENTLFGADNDAGFQFFQGWNLDAVAAARVHMYKGLYFEFEEKFVYARYFGVNIDRGKAGHSVKSAEFAFHFGWSFW